MIDEGIVASTMSLAYWKGLVSPTLSKSGTMLTTFDGRYFQLHGILPSLEVQLGGNIVAIEVEVVDAPLTIIFYRVETRFITCKQSHHPYSRLFVFL